MLYRCMPPEMIRPWKGKYAEIRCHDIAAKNVEEFKAFVEQYTGPKLRFLDMHYGYNGPVRLSYRKRSDICRYLLNYMGRDRRYSEKIRNCQTFAADFYGFVAGKKGVEPSTP